MTGKREGNKPLTQQAVFRIGLILITVLVVFAFVRQSQVPASFGQYGRFRGDSISEAASKKIIFAGSSKDCSGCHQQVIAATSRGKHGDMDCQSCHGPAARHLDNPGVWSPVVKGDEELCASCHRQIAGRTKKQVATVKPLLHSGGMECTGCHDPHEPWSRLGG